MPNKTKITSFSHDGRGIAHIDNKIIFLAGGLPGEEVEFNYTKKHSNYDEGVVTSIINPSPYRVEPPCLHFGNCGGCSLQYISTDGQLACKEHALLEQLEHLGHVKPEKMLPPLIGPSYGYRRKARLGAKFVIKKNKVLVGFREQNGRFLADLQSCKILEPSVGTVIDQLANLLTNLISRNHIPQIEVAIGDDAIGLVFRHMEKIPESDIEQIIKFAEQHKLRIYLQPKGPDSVQLLCPKNDDFYLHYSLPKYNLTFAFHPSDFTQVNSKINEAMINRAIELLTPQSNETILDLFCGLGNFTLPFAKYCKNIIGIEGELKMVGRAKENAKQNNIDNAEFYCADLTHDINTFAWAKQKFSKIILDPPRTGAIEIMKNIVGFGAKKILYISCNPATLARDAATLVSHGYKLECAGIMDMFPQTKHVEAIALFDYSL
jgi:23S rRNA (uracil1939-C5)-methyltransferase